MSIRAFTLAAVAAAIVSVLPLARATIVPNGSSYPFAEWTRGSAGSSYAHWDEFASATEPNSPDAGNFQASTATLVETTAGASGAFIAGSINIYSHAAPTYFAVTMPGLDLGSGYDTRFVTQIVTLGSELDYSSVVLGYDGGGQQLAPATQAELGRIHLGGFGGDLVTTLFVWDLLSVSPSELVLTFNAAGSSMSLDQVVIDTFAVASSAPVAGDFDGDGVVDSNDLSLWRTQFGTIGPAADGNGDGTVDAADYTIWRDAQLATNLAVGGSTAVPEPAPAALLVCGLLVVMFVWGSDRCLAARSTPSQKV